MSDSDARLEAVNELLKTIGDNGRNFFKTKDNYAHFEIDTRGRVWFHDDYTKKRIYTHYKWRWKGFSHGGTLKSLVCTLAKFIKTGKQLNHSFGPWSSNYCDGDLWGYGDSMEIVRNKAVELGVTPELLEVAS